MGWMATRSVSASDPFTPATGARTSLPRTLRGWLEEAGLLMLSVLLFPLSILLVGTPVALLIWVLAEIARR
jgi:hypothetical protein